MTSAGKPPGAAAMSDYEAKAWQAAIDAFAQSSEKRRLPAPLQRAGVRARRAVTGTMERAPVPEQVEDAFTAAVRGLQRVTFDPALHSVDVDKVVRKYAKQHPQVTALVDVRRIDLRYCDVALPRVRTRYAAMAAAQGGATAVAVTGAVVSSTVTGGVTASAAIAAVAADTAATLAFMGRVIAMVAAHYGYDVREPEEEVFALGVVSVASAGTQTGKMQALTSLSKLTQQMMRQATWTQLRGNQLVRVIDKVYLALGFKLTKAKLAQAVPVAGVALNAGLSAELAARTFRRAREAYRLRFLTEKHGLDPDAWVQQPTADPDEVAEGDIVDVVELLAASDAEGMTGEADGDRGPDKVGLVVEHCREIGVATDVPWPGGWPGEIEPALIDAVLSIRAQYGSPTTGVRRCVGNWRRSRNTICDDLSSLAAMDGPELASILDNRQRLGGGPLKAEAVVAAAANLVEGGVRHASDLASPTPAHKRAYTSVKGLGPVTWEYFLMLLGAPSVKADTWICRFVADALSVPAVEPQIAADLVRAAAERLDIDASQLDHAIWLSMRSGRRRR